MIDNYINNNQLQEWLSIRPNHSVVAQNYDKSDVYMDNALSVTS